MESYNWSDWTDWTPLENINFSEVASGAGAYAVATNRPLARAIGIDPEGILHMGESAGLRQRLKDFIRCATRRGEEGHMAGWRYSFFRFDRHYPFATLRVRWIDTASKEDARHAESEILLDYLQRHSELPPLNYSFNWKIFESVGWDIFDEQVT